MEILKDYQKAAGYLKNGKIGIIPTDTIYGISCSAFSKENVEKIYEIKQRDFDKPFIILISSPKDLEKFKLKITEFHKKIFKKYWPGPVSIILDVKHDEFSYLHRGKSSLAFRLPNDEKLKSLLKITGPLVSTSANTSENPPINSLDEAVEIFDKKLDFMLDIGSLKNKNPSKIILIEDGKEKVIR
jgi:L-threonylcarbamoyladenylate synthase